MFYKFIFVREPMARLASCYNDKFVTNNEEKLVDYRKEIKKMAHKINNVIGGNVSEPVTFQEFLQVVVLRQKTSALTFSRHWAPYYKLCSPCFVNYDFIGKLDTNSDDIQVGIYLNYTGSNNNSYTVRA